MKKVHMGNNKSLANPASTNKIVPFYGIWCLDAYFERLNDTLNDFISPMEYI